MAAGPVSGHAFHLGTLLGPALLLAFWAGWSDVRAWLHRHDDLPSDAVLVAAALCAGAAVIHALVTPVHFAEDPLYGGFFAVLAIAQLSWAAAVVVRRGPGLLLLGAAGNIAVVGLWLATRTAGIPLGVATGRREPLGALDLTCAVLELGVAVSCMALLRRPEPVPA
jgi:hypothetical protein